jgi:hypothetical protein
MNRKMSILRFGKNEKSPHDNAIPLWLFALRKINKDAGKKIFGAPLELIPESETQSREYYGPLRSVVFCNMGTDQGEIYITAETELIEPMREYLNEIRK